MRRLTDADRIKALLAHLDRGGAPAVTALGVAQGAPFTIVVSTHQTPLDPPVE